MKNIDLVLIDGRNLFWRCASVLYPDVNEVFSLFLRILVNLRKKFDGLFVICWEGGRRSNLYRTQMYPNYKLRKTTPERTEIIENMIPYLKELKILLEGIGIKQAYADRWEADDVIATLSVWAENRDYKTIIYSNDADLTQCVTRKTLIAKPPYKTEDEIQILGVKGVKEKYNVFPNQIPYFKSLSGDPSDNYPGVQGIGKTLAARLIDILPDFHDLIDCDDKPNIPRLSQRLWNNIIESKRTNKLHLFFELATVNRNVRTTFVSGKYDFSDTIKMLRKMKVKDFMRQSSIYELKGLAT